MIPFFLIFFSVLALDVGTKILVRASLPMGTEVHLLPFFSLTHVENTGIAFGLFPGRNAILIGLGILIMTVMTFSAIRLLRQDRFIGLVLAAVLGGALGNIADRVFNGAVTDFLDFYWGAYHWPSFNVADSAICVGMVLLIGRSFFGQAHGPDPL